MQWPGAGKKKPALGGPGMDQNQIEKSCLVP